MTVRDAMQWGVRLGIYEKALTGDTLDELFASAARAGYAFVDLSLDESPARLARLLWTRDERIAVRDAAVRAGVEIGGLCLSAHRTIAPGSVDPAQRRRAVEILVQAIDLARDLGATIVQIAGYYAHLEEPRDQARADYIDVLRIGADHAALRGVMLGLENVDGTDVVSIDAALAIVAEVGSPWLGVYPDIGNFVVQSRDVAAEVRAAARHALAWHVKDARPGEPRRVPMGGGDVPWDVAFAELAAQRWSGRVMVEMWNDDVVEAESLAAEAGGFIADRLAAAGIPVHPPALKPEKLETRR